MREATLGLAMAGSGRRRRPEPRSQEFMTSQWPGIVGRERELAALDDFLREPGALLLTGEPGIGKTTLWEAGIQSARTRGLRVLAARPSGAEAELAFATLTDLLEDVESGALADLPAPQRRALEVALLRVEPEAEPAEPRAIGLGFLNALRVLSAAEPLLVAIDDVQWLDAASEEALAFAARRLGDAAVGFLLTKRADSVSPLETALTPGTLAVAPLSLGATRRVLYERLGLSVSRRVLRQVVDSAGGNPLFAVELGRTLAERGSPEIGEDIEAPEALEDLVGARVARLPDDQHRLLLAVALSSDLRLPQLAAIAEPGTIDDALDAGLLVVDRDRVRASHPLLGAAARLRSRASERRELHLALAGAVAPERRALHLALTADRPDAALAATVADAAVRAEARTAAEEAAALAQHALRLTPPRAPERTERLLALGHYLIVAGEHERVTELLAPEIDSLPAGAARARAHLLLANGGAIETVADHDRQVDQAFAESEDHPGLRAQAVAMRTTSTVLARIERIGAAEAWAADALPAAREAGAAIEREVLTALGWARVLRGRPVDDLVDRFHAASDAPAYTYQSVDRPAAVRLTWRGDVEGARTALGALLRNADERGEAVAYAAVRLNLCELHLRSGDCTAAARLLDEWGQSGDDMLLLGPHYQRCRALLAAIRGLPGEVEEWAAKTIADAQAAGIAWDDLDAHRARGLAALRSGDPAGALENLRPVWEHMQREGVDDPGVFPVAPDLVDALAETGERDEALALIGRLTELAAEQDHPWAHATAERCGAVVALAADTYDADAAAALERASGAYEELGLGFDAARSLLSLGRSQRRFKKWGAARSALERAAARFDTLEATGWAELAREELGRVGARRPAPSGDLTPTEKRVVELAVEGRSNKEIARILFVTVHTVEVHLSHSYAKLGVRSRTQLAGRLAEDA